jgi:hypothetical protein
MKIGAWFQSHTDLPLETQIEQAAHNGLTTLRSYEINYSKKVLPVLKQTGMSLMAGMDIKDGELLADWRSQVRLDELAQYHALGFPLETICVGNELRENGSAPHQKRFTARLAFGLANVLSTYRHWLDEHGYHTPLTYAMEGIVFDREGYFNEWVWPVIDACDIISLNLYPMDHAAWYTFGAFEESRLFLRDSKIRHERLTLFELGLRRALDQLEAAGKPLILSEIGFPSAVGYHLEGDQLVIPESDNACYEELMLEFATLLRRVEADYPGQIQALYFYEWRDNLYHGKITQEQSPIHVAFGLCDRFGTPKLNLKQLMSNLLAN